MLVYVGSDILEIRPQQIIESAVELDYPYLKPIETKKKVSYKKKTKVNIKEDKNGDDR